MMSIWEVLSSVDGWMQLARFVLDARRMCMRLETAPMYRPRSVGSDVLSQVIDLHFKAFVEHIEEQGGFVPAYVKRAFWSYLGCGRPEGGSSIPYYVPPPPPKAWRRSRPGSHHPAAPPPTG